MRLILALFFCFFLGSAFAQNVVPAPSTFRFGEIWYKVSLNNDNPLDLRITDFSYDYADKEAGAFALNGCNYPQAKLHSENNVLAQVENLEKLYPGNPSFQYRITGFKDCIYNSSTGAQYRWNAVNSVGTTSTFSSASYVAINQTFQRSCPAPYSYNKTTDTCESSCVAGEERERVNFAGWGKYRTDSGGQYPTDLGGSVDLVGSVKSPPSESCINQCSTVQSGTIDYYVETVAGSNGHFRIESKTNYMLTGASCSEPETTNTETAAPPCDGNLGQVNGVSVCLPNGNDDGGGTGEGSDGGGGTGGGSDGGGTGGGSDGGGTGGGSDGGGGTGGGSDGGGGTGGGSDGGGTGGGSDGGGGTGGGSDGGGGEGEGEGEGDCEGSDCSGIGPGTDLPGACESDQCLYEPKYPDGLRGVYESFMADVRSTQIYVLANSLMPTYNSGSCPNFSFDFNMGGSIGNLGTHTLEIPCEIWPILRAIVLVLALILARKLVFGG